MDSTKIFISHHDPEPAKELDTLIDKTSRGRLRTFNTSRPSRGMAAGDHIDPVLIREISEATLIVSLWTPKSVASPAWMTWELGAAVALNQGNVVVARALGLRPDELPLNLRSNYAPDLGDDEDCLEFITHIVSRVGLDDGEPLESTFRETFQRWGPKEMPNPLRAVKVTEEIVTVTGGTDYILVENSASRPIHAFTSVLDKDMGLRRIAEILNSKGPIEPAQRVVIPTSKLLPAIDHGKAAGTLEWTQASVGRQWQDIMVRQSPFASSEAD